MKVPALILFITALLLPACTTAMPDGNILETNAAILQKVQDTATAQAFLINRSTATYTATHTKVPSQTPSPTTTPVAQSTATSELEYPVLTAATEIPALGASGMADLHGVILFLSRDPFPFIPLIANERGAAGTDNVHPVAFFHRKGEISFSTSKAAPAKYLSYGGLSRICTDSVGYHSLGCLWALSPDGQSAGMLSAQEFDFNWYLPPNGPPQFVENGFVTNHPAIQPVRLPEICSQDPASSLDQRCDRIRFSPDGRFLAFRYGEEACAKRAAQIIDRETGAVVQNFEGGVDGFEPLPYGKLMIQVGSCGGMGMYFFDPATRQMVWGGGDGYRVWNQSRSLMIVSESSGMGFSMGIWAYNLKTGTVIYPEGKPGFDQQSWPADEHGIVLPDDRRFLYQHLRIKAEGVDTAWSPVIDTPAQIVRYDPTTGQRTVLASDPAYHYRLCQFDNEQPCPVQWYGDWIQVQRVPFTVVRPGGDLWSISTELPCFAEGKDCVTPPESFALNAHTGELRPWDPTALPLAYPTPTPTRGPDIQDEPVYSDPAGMYALYVGADGKSLWMQPKEGPAFYWASGEGFFYLP